jgi:hypothetical protein
MLPDHTYLTRSTHSNLSRSLQQIWTDPLLMRRRLSGPRVQTHILSHNSKWNSWEKTSFCWQSATRLTGLISPECNRYIQYLLVGANPLVLNRHRRGATTLEVPVFHISLPDLPNWRSSAFHLRAPPDLRLPKSNMKHLVKCDMKHLSLTHGLLATRYLLKPMSTPSSG